jgi:hypothetical protein
MRIIPAGDIHFVVTAANFCADGDLFLPGRVERGLLRFGRYRKQRYDDELEEKFHADHHSTNGCGTASFSGVVNKAGKAFHLCSGVAGVTVG